MQNKKLHNLYSSLNIIKVIASRRIRSIGHVSLMGGIRNIYKITGKTPL
jgi:hypothetical protein